MHYLLIYDLAEDYLIRRPQHRDKHLAHAWTASDRGELILGGALTDPCDQAILLFHGESPEVAERFARADPYVLDGLVLRWRIRPWATVAGATSAAPVRPCGRPTLTH